MKALTRPLAFVCYAVGILILTGALVYLDRLDALHYLARAWWHVMILLAFAGASASAWFFLHDAGTWAKRSIHWRVVGLNVGGFLLCCAGALSVVYLTARELGWLALK